MQCVDQPSPSRRWSFSAVVLASSAQYCPQYGFFFARIRLKSLGFHILNLVLYSLVMLMCVILLLIFAVKEMSLLQRSQDPQIRYSPFLERFLTLG